MKFGNEFWLILFQEYISPKLFAVRVLDFIFFMGLMSGSPERRGEGGRGEGGRGEGEGGGGKSMNE